MQHNYPQIYSLSTIGIKQHLDSDYRFHSYRTDFSGDSGSGKSMVADMIQLILVGSGEFRSATDAKRERPVKGMLINQKGQSSSRGYIFLNIEIRHKQFIVIGAYIESTNNIAEMFIIQNGYDWNNLTPFSKPISYKDLIVNDTIETLKSLCEKEGKIVIKSFKRRHYHQVLYNENILAIDLTKDESLKTYGSILRSFSRGKGFNTESENLKKFLFGDEQNHILNRYNEEVNNINNDFHDHRRYLGEINLIKEKQKILQTVFEYEKKYKANYSEYLIKRYNYWSTINKRTINQQQKTKKLLERKKNEIQFTENQIYKLEIKDLQELLKIKERLFYLKSNNISNKEVEKLFLESTKSKEIIETFEKWLKKNNDKVENVAQWYNFQMLQIQNKRALKNFTEYLTNNGIFLEFEKSNWYLDFENEQKNMLAEVELLEKEILTLTSLSKFTNANHPESLLRWAIENLPFPVSHIEESILIYFQKYGKIKPTDYLANRYIPFPEEIFLNLDHKIKDISATGFWLNLDGVYEYIEYSPEQMLNVNDSQSITDALLILKENLDIQLAQATSRINHLKNYYKILLEYPQLKEHILIYNKREEINHFEIDTELKDMHPDLWEKYISFYNDRHALMKAYQYNLKAYQDYINYEGEIKSLTEKEKDFNNYYFKGLQVEERIITIKIEDLQNNLSEDGNFSSFNNTKYTIASNNIRDLTSIKYELINEQQKLNIEVDNNDKLIQKSIQELDYTNILNDEIFNSEIVFNTEFEELINPEEDKYGESLKEKAIKAETIYKQYLTLITQELPLDKTVTIGQLARYLLPTVFTKPIVDENLISANIAEKLNKLTHDIQEIGSRKVEILGSIFNEVYNIYSNYLTRIKEIDSYLRKKNITGGNRASLTYKKSPYFPESWLLHFRKQLNTQMNHTGLFNDLKEEIDINQMMIKAFHQFGGSDKVEPKDLVDPKSYFDLEFDLKLENDEINSGSNGQTYTANALLCLARLSLIEDKDKKGIKIMPIDETEGLGSNYEMLHQLAKKEKYQILTMAIETAGEITDDGQYIYILNGNSLANTDGFVPPVGIFANEVYDNIESYLNNTENE